MTIKKRMTAFASAVVTVVALAAGFGNALLPQAQAATCSGSSGFCVWDYTYGNGASLGFGTKSGPSICRLIDDLRVYGFNDKTSAASNARELPSIMYEHINRTGITYSVGPWTISLFSGTAFDNKASSLLVSS